MNGERLYGTRVGEALAFGADEHARQTRKGKGEPYLSHILAVAGLVAHYGGDEEQIMAAVLHDAVEDQGGSAMAERIRRRFGDRVADIVLACSDAIPEPGTKKEAWHPRKEAYIATLRQPDPHGARLVEVCDKLANLRDIVEDVEANGAAAFKHFKGGRDGTIWYYQQMGEVLVPQVPQVASEYTRLLARLEAAAVGQLRRTLSIDFPLASSSTSLSR